MVEAIQDPRNAKPKCTILLLMNSTKQPSSSHYLNLQICSPPMPTSSLLMASWAFLISLSFFPIFTISLPCTFIITNNCPFTIWPGTLSGAGTPPLPATGFQLDSGQSITVPTTPGWSGRIWARTGCTFDATGSGTCQTGDCGGKLQCNGMGATPPASLFEITLGVGDGKDFYDVSVVDGYNLPVVAFPRGAGGECNATGCVQDINMGCPKELQVVGTDGGEGGGVVACKSACGAFGLDEYCCSGEFANPTACRPSFYSGIFKRACPRAYSYAFDDGTSIFTCKASQYNIIFCPNSGMRIIDGGLQIPGVEERIATKTNHETASSSTLLIQFPISTICLLFTLFYLNRQRCSPIQE